MDPKQVTIEDWDGDGAIRIPDEVLQDLGVDVGGILYVIEEYVGNVRCLVLSKTPRITKSFRPSPTLLRGRRFVGWQTSPGWGWAAGL